MQVFDTKELENYIRSTGDTMLQIFKISTELAYQRGYNDCMKSKEYKNNASTSDKQE